MRLRGDFWVALRSKELRKLVRFFFYRPASACLQCSPSSRCADSHSSQGSHLVRLEEFSASCIVDYASLSAFPLLTAAVLPVRSNGEVQETIGALAAQLTYLTLSVTDPPLIAETVQTVARMPRLRVLTLHLRGCQPADALEPLLQPGPLRVLVVNVFNPAAPSDEIPWKKVDPNVQDMLRRLRNDRRLVLRSLLALLWNNSLAVLAAHRMSARGLVLQSAACDELLWSGPLRPRLLPHYVRTQLTRSALPGE
jgi:hypothetical protein